MPAKAAGVAAGDVIVKIGAAEWPSTDQVFEAVEKAGKKPITLVVLRGAEQKTFELTPKEGRLGIAMGVGAPVVIKPLPDSPAAKLAMPLPPGTRITAIDGVKVDSVAAMQRAFAELARKNPGGFTATLDTLPNEGKTIEPLAVKLAIGGDEAKELAHAGWEMGLNPFVFSVELVTLQRSSPSGAIALGIEKTRQSMIQVYLTLLRVFQGSVHPKNFQGPVGIAHTGTKIAKQGWTYLIFFLGLISVNLAVINFLPIPIVDGGHIVFLIIEKIKGSPVGPRVQTAALFVGLALLACMFLYVTFNDIVRLFGLA
jgi:regulator of sigma E protease